MARAKSVLLVVACALLMSVFRVVLKIGGFGRTSRLYRRLAGLRDERSRPAVEDAALTRQVEEAVSRVAVFFPGRARCLERSLTIGLLLRWRGIPARVRLGVQPFPFFAHAWVEVDGVRIDPGDLWVTGLNAFPMEL